MNDRLLVRERSRAFAEQERRLLGAVAIAATVMILGLAGRWLRGRPPPGPAPASRLGLLRQTVPVPVVGAACLGAQLARQIPATAGGIRGAGCEPAEHFGATA